MKEIFKKIISKLKKFFILIKKNLSSVLNNRIKPFFIQKKEQVQKKYRERIDKKKQILNFQVRESFNKIRINMDTLSIDSKSKCILISSPSLSDGKTTICFYMAHYMAQFGKRTLIIDCNMRAPKMSTIFQTDKKTPGLSNVLANESNLQECIQATDIKNLYILTAGRLAIDPVGLLGSSRMDNLIESVADEFDYVLLDTPSILLVPDTIALAKHIVNIYLVVRHNYTKNQDIISALDALDLINCSAKGIIYNDAPIDKYDSNLVYNSNEFSNYIYDTN